jgi:hypothetical protein
MSDGVDLEDPKTLRAHAGDCRVISRGVDTREIGGRMDVYILGKATEALEAAARRLEGAGERRLTPVPLSGAGAIAEYLRSRGMLSMADEVDDMARSRGSLRWLLGMRR